jgi:hypothetical protein
MPSFFLFCLLTFIVCVRLFLYRFRMKEDITLRRRIQSRANTKDPSAASNAPQPVMLKLLLRERIACPVAR